MIPSMIAFERALSKPSLSFKRLRDIKPSMENGRIAIRRTQSAMEAEIEWNERHYIIYLPFDSKDIQRMAEFELESCEHSRGPLIENRILYNEVTLTNSLGQREEFAVILQETYGGMMLDKAVTHYKADDLLCAVERMRRRLDEIGFQHNNLRPTNVLICKSGTARPLKYWYAEWRDLAENNITPLLALIEQSKHIGTKSLAQEPIGDEYAEPRAYEGITRLCKHGRYGFVGDDGRAITRYIFSWASNFQEGRAIVVQNNKMGAINSEGKKVIRAMYEHLEYDVATGTFIAILGKYKYFIDYNGKKIAQANVESSNRWGGVDEIISLPR